MIREDMSIIDFSKTRKKHISLTFDDGPDKNYTPKVLNILKRYKIKATFFLVGKKARKNPNIVMRIFEEDHDIGNHTYSHPVSPIFNFSIIGKEIELATAAIKKITGQKPFLFRPTWAPWDMNSKKMSDVATNLNYLPVKWSISAMDWLGIKKVIRYKILNSHTKHGDVLLLHDGAEKSPFLKRKATVDLLPEILESLKNKNCSPLKLSELLKI